MPESRIAATDRLRQEGRWDEACLFRDEVKKQLVRTGWPAQLPSTTRGRRCWRSTRLCRKRSR